MPKLKTLNSKTLGVLMGLSAGILWGSNPIFPKLIEGLSSLGLAVGRMGFGFLFITLGILLAGRFKEVIASARHWRMWLLLGLLMSVHWTAIMVGFRNTLAGNAAILGNTNTLFLLILASFFLKERLSLRDYFWVGITFFGITLIFFGKGFSLSLDHLQGDLSALFGAFLFAVYTLLIRKERRYPFYIMMFWLFLISGIFMVLASVLFHWPLLVPGGEVVPLSWVYLASMGLLGTALGHSAYNLSLRYVRSDQASLLGLMSPVTTLVLGYWILGESFSWQGLLGIFITLMGIVGIVRSGAKTPRWAFWKKRPVESPPEM